ncbi:O-antigen ligase family protein [Patescibacteria group bacterium]|nr:O-antigen ligase family protein [Patescibacteria group bacterium]
MNLNLKNVLVWVIKGLLFIVPFVALYIAAGLFFPFITGKAFAFRIIVELVFVLWVALAIFCKEYRPQRNILFYSLVIFTAIVSLATIFGVNPLRSFWSNFERMEGLITYFHLFAYFLVIGNVFRKKDWFVFFNLFVIAGWFENIYAFLQKTGRLASLQGGFRVDGTIGNPAYLAAYLIFILGFAILLFADTKKLWAKIYYAVSALFTLSTIYFTASRGPTLGILGAIILVFIIYLFVNSGEVAKKSKKIVLSILLFTVLICGGLWLAKDTSFVQSSPVLSRLTSLSFSERTITSRFTIWNMSWQAVKERPVLGWGPENYVVVFSEYYQPELWRQEPWFDRSHNVIFDWLINAGFLGLLSYLFILISAIYLLYRNFKENKIPLSKSLIVVGIFVAYFFQNLFIFDNIATYTCFFALLAYIYSVNKKEEITLEQDNSKASEYLMPATILAVIIFIFIGYSLVLKPFLANKYLLGALKENAGGDVVETANLFSKSLSINTFLGKSEARSQFANFAVGSALLSNQLNDEQKSQLLVEAIAEIEQDKNENLLDPRPSIYLGIIYSKINQIDKAIEAYENALKISPRKQDILFSLADCYMAKDDYKQALLILKKAYEEDPEFTVARIYLAGMYIMNNQQDKADELLLEGFGAVNVADEFLVKVYYKSKNYLRLIDTWQAYVNKDENNINYRKSLAETYLLVSQPDKAIEELEKIIEINPLVEEEVREYIRQIKGN